MNSVKDLYKAHYEFHRDTFTKGESKYYWAIFYVFDICTYDSYLDELFMKAIIEVCKVIRDRTNFEYIKNEQDYIKYILVCQVLDNFHWIEWGTSIRGAWFDAAQGPYVKSRVILEEQEWWDSERHVIDGVEFTEDNLFALIEFLEEE